MIFSSILFVLFKLFTSGNACRHNQQGPQGCYRQGLPRILVLRDVATEFWNDGNGIRGDYPKMAEQFGWAVFLKYNAINPIINYSPRFAWGGRPHRKFISVRERKHCFWHVSSQTNSNLHVFCHKGSKSFQNIAFDSVFVIFPVKHTVIYTFFCYNVSPKHLFLQCFQCSGIQKPCKILLCIIFFAFLVVFPVPESYQNDPKIHFNTLLRSDTQKSSKKVENTTMGWSRCETIFGVWSRCETVFGVPPQLKLI